MNDQITDTQWKQYEDEGWLNLGPILNSKDLAALQQRIDDIMLGKAPVNYDGLLMQLDSESGKYEDAGEQSRGHKGATLNYRKIQDLEHDPLFLEYMQRPIFRDVCERVYGKGVPIGCFRAMFMNKPARKGTWLPWHQDRWNFLDRDPLLTVWTALDPCTAANGCVQVIPKSHKLGLLNPGHLSGFLTPELAKEHCPSEKAVLLELKAGEVVLLHNWLLHASDVNRSEISRRGFSVCYMDGRTHSRKEDERYSPIFGAGALTPDGVAARASAAKKIPA
ncbi:MAG: phytanoyl-CoA dioxygenase family protein [Verrucomicrobiae bacterium]|nr:phytanoyl-CoA dioxygenase family protein [Verrucomicrobiae bacterium]